MDKQQTLEHLRAAKASHLEWTQHAKFLIRGMNIEEKAIPVNSMDCNFGKWFYKEGQKLNGLPNNPAECMSEIEQLHFQLHDVYFNIYNIYYTKQKKGFLSKIFGDKREVSAQDVKMAEKYFEELEVISKKLIEELNRLERRLLAVPDKKIEELF
ncbi:hypothetical protein FJR48_04125 [Sulfurimonas lithotrophica]|mgnify:CR=1 FL=1|uniref:Chemoreceptor zinc-binding domain-containing protein n=1 Tax=Sulfurimonas lithotrophica TaxID=2590022 RepID=A0A5P8P024_9BACT|nr:CZB domain-containing protein [Sulfurimonas lithotrophica]QFR48950.1 hypothetical protein FJR48_04125 [Sulfurimonas lithotrophica]